MEPVLAVPYTHLFLAAVVAYALPAKLPECSMDWQGYKTVITKEASADKVVVVFQVRDRITRFEFKGSKVVVTAPALTPDGKNATAKGSYDLEAVFGVGDPAKWATAKELVLTSKTKKAVTLRLSRAEKEVRVEETDGHSQAVFGFQDKKFPSATIRWK